MDESRYFDIDRCCPDDRGLFPDRQWGTELPPLILSVNAGRSRSDVETGAFTIKPHFIAILAGATAVDHKEIAVGLKYQ